jgi:hypothetical protein
VLEALTCASFQPVINESFELRDNTAVPRLDLICAEPLDPKGRVVRPPFHLIFRGPSAPVLDQRIHALSHPTFGALEIFLVPIGPDDLGQCYEAVFG